MLAGGTDQQVERRKVGGVQFVLNSSFIDCLWRKRTISDPPRECPCGSALTGADFSG